MLKQFLRVTGDQFWCDITTQLKLDRFIGNHVGQADMFETREENFDQTAFDAWAKDRNVLEVTQRILIGARDLDAPESEFVAANNIKRPSSEDALGVLEYLRIGGFSSLYIHLDFDAFDPSEIDFTRFPTPGGLSIQTVVTSLEKLRSEFKVIGCALTECGPRDEAHWQSDHHKLEPILAALPIT